MIDEDSLAGKVLQMHRQGFVTGAIAMRLSVDSNFVRRIVRTHLEAVAEASKPHYDSKADRQRAEARNRAAAKVAKAQKAYDEAKAALADLD